MHILLLGTGMQGRAALHDLVHNREVASVTAADLEHESLAALVRDRWWNDRVRPEALDVNDPAQLDRLMALGPDVILDLLPVPCHGPVIEAALRHGIHLVHASYAGPDAEWIGSESKKRGVTILPEMGLDPGLDLILAGEAVRSFDAVESLVSYGAGFPEAEAADNPICYKVTWRFEGVLSSYHRAGRVIRDGQVIEIDEKEMFRPEHVHLVEIEGVGTLEGFPNGDALKYAGPLGLDTESLTRLERCVLRWPGHSAFWRTVAELGLLDDEPVLLDGTAVDRKRFLAEALAPRLRYADGERDTAVVRVDVTGMREGRRERAVYQIVDRRDLETGLSAMNRTVGFTAAIGARMVGSGVIDKRGLLSPVNDVPFGPFVEALAERGIEVSADRSDSSQ